MVGYLQNTRLYHILNCQGTITGTLTIVFIILLYHILNRQGTITLKYSHRYSNKLYHILNCQGTITKMV